MVLLKGMRVRVFGMISSLGNISKHYLCVERILIYFTTVYQNVYVRRIDVHHVHCISAEDYTYRARANSNFSMHTKVCLFVFSKVIIPLSSDIPLVVTSRGGVQI